MPLSPELIAALEEDQGVRLPPEDAAAAQSFLDVYRLVLRELGVRPGESMDLQSWVFRRLRRVLIDARAAAPDKISLSARLRDVLPRGRRWVQVQDLLSRANVPLWLPELPRRVTGAIDSWTYGAVIALVIVPMLLLLISAGKGGVAEIVLFVVMVGAAYGSGRFIHRRLTARALLQAAHVTGDGTFEQFVASCLGPRGARLSLYDRRLASVWRTVLLVVSDHTGLQPLMIAANPALPLGEHSREKWPQLTPEMAAASAFGQSSAVSRQCLAQIIAAFMRGEITSFEVCSVFVVLVHSQEEDLTALPALLEHTLDTKHDAPIAVSEETWEYLRRLLAALRSDLPIRRCVFHGADYRHRPAELALEPFWTAEQWKRYEPLLSDLELPEFDPTLQSSPAAAARRRSRVRGTPRKGYCTIMVEGDNAEAGFARRA